MMISRLMQSLVSIGATMVLARLLSPRDFGLIAMTMTLTGLATTLRGFGLSMALIYVPELDRTTLSRLFRLNFRLSALMGLFMAAMAPILSWFFKEPVLAGMTLLITVGIFLSGISELHLGLLRRWMRFGAISWVELGSLTVGATVGIIVALAGASYWALALQMLAVHLSMAGIAWLKCGWRPSGSWEQTSESEARLGSILSYGKNTILARLLGYLETQLDHILVGRFAGTGQLGLYQKAFQWSNFPVNQLYMPFKMVAIATWSRLQGDPDKYRSYARKTFLVVFSLTTPAIGFLFVEVHDVVLLLLGPKWMAVVPIFRVMAVMAFADCVGRITKWIYQAEGQTRRRLTWMIISTPLKITGMVLGIPWGALGIAVGYTAAVCLLAYPAVLFCLRVSPLKPRDFWAGVWRPALTTLIVCTLFTAFQEAMPRWEALPARLAGQAGAYLAFITGIWVALPGGVASLREIVKAIRRR